MKRKSIDHAQLLLLKLLSGEDMYGYQIILELARRSSNVFELKEGTLYPILHGLEQDKCVSAYEKEAPTGRKRKYYHITRRGLELLEQKQEEWRFFTGKVDGVVFGDALAPA